MINLELWLNKTINLETRRRISHNKSRVKEIKNNASSTRIRYGAYKGANTAPGHQQQEQQQQRRVDHITHAEQRQQQQQQQRERDQDPPFLAPGSRPPPFKIKAHKVGLWVYR